jgi:drug/metabolite transporter (DMT)-like permease
MSRQLRAHLSVLLANLIYGANYSIAKGVMPEFIKPFGFIIIRVWVAAMLFVISAQLLFREKIKRSDWPLFIGCAVFGVAINQLLFFKGLSLTSPINSGLIMVTNPIFVLIGSAMVAREKITLLKVLGILCGLSGAVLLILYGQRFSSSASDTLGDICILFNSLSYAVYLVMVRPLMQRYHPVTIMQVVFLIGSLLVLPFGLEEFNEIRWQTFGLSTWLATAFVVIGTTFLAYLFNTLALRELSANMVSVYIYLQPLLAAGFAMLLGKDTPNVLHLISAALIFNGIWLTMRSGKS